MGFDVNNPYFRNQVLTASPEQLRLLLIEGGLRFLRDGRQAMTDDKYELVYESLGQARDIVMELINGLRHDISPDLCKNLEALYVFMYRRIVEGSFEKDTVKIDEIIGLLDYERETWVMLIEKLNREAEQNTPQSAPALQAAEQQAGVPDGYRPLSVEG
jgi:flagellar protein FliS